jgi:hypothetical protein
MLNQRLSTVVYRRANYYEWIADRSVKFHFSNDFSESLVVKRLNNLIDRIDRINGSELSTRELIRGKARPDDIPLRAKIARDIVITSASDSTEKNPYLSGLAVHDELRAKPKTQRELIVEQAIAWQAKQDAEAARVAMESDPEWRTRHTTAGEAYLLARYTGAPESEYQLAEARLRAVNDPVAFAEADKVFKERAAQRLAHRDAAIQSELARLNAEKAGLLDGSIEPPPPSADAWAAMRDEANVLKRDGRNYFPQAGDEIDALHAGVQAGTISPPEFQQRVTAIREASHEAG